MHEDNQDKGAWNSEERIYFHSSVGVPECLKMNMTVGRGSTYGRINCKEFCEGIRNRVAIGKPIIKTNTASLSNRFAINDISKSIGKILDLMKEMTVYHKTYGQGTATAIISGNDLIKVKFGDRVKNNFLFHCVLKKIINFKCKKGEDHLKIE